MNKVLTVLFICFSLILPAQDNKKKDTNDIHSVSDVDEQVMTYVEQMPEFPGGQGELLKYLSSNIIYPKSAIDSGIQGKVLLKFVVKKDGSISDVEIVKGVNSAIDREAIRVVSAMPRWKPGKQNGSAVNVAYMVPIKFNLK
jgi:protein TonB